MPIKHKQYHGDNVQSLGFQAADGHDMTVGVLLPGNYDFGVALRSETTVVVWGVLRCSKGSYQANGIPCQFQAGDHIQVWCDDPVVYLCHCT